VASKFVAQPASTKAPAVAVFIDGAVGVAVFCTNTEFPDIVSSCGVVGSIPEIEAIHQAPLSPLPRVKVYEAGSPAAFVIFL